MRVWPGATSPLSRTPTRRTLRACSPTCAGTSAPTRPRTCSSGPSWTSGAAPSATTPTSGSRAGCSPSRTGGRWTRCAVGGTRWSTSRPPGRSWARTAARPPSATPTPPRCAPPSTGLPEHERQVLELAYYSDLTQPEIAARLDVPLGTVKARAARGTRRLGDAAQHRRRRGIAMNHPDLFALLRGELTNRRGDGGGRAPRRLRRVPRRARRAGGGQRTAVSRRAHPPGSGRYGGSAARRTASPAADRCAGRHPRAAALLAGAAAVVVGCRRSAPLDVGLARRLVGRRRDRARTAYASVPLDAGRGRHGRR